VSGRGVYSSLKARLGLCHAYDNATPGLGQKRSGAQVVGSWVLSDCQPLLRRQTARKKKKTSRIPGVSLEKHHWKLFGIAVLILICSSSPFYSGRLQVLCSIRSLLGFHRPAGSNSTDIMNLIFSYVILSLSGTKLRTYYSVLTRRHSAALPQAHRHQGPSFYSTRESVRYT
jgi:hypothetical protein